MPSASITARKTKRGERRYAVRFRLGGRAYPVEHGGSFSTMREARVRRDLIAGELAAAGLERGDTGARENRNAEEKPDGDLAEHVRWLKSAM